MQTMLHKNNLKLTVVLCVLFSAVMFFPCTVKAQLSSVKQLKKVTKDLKLKQESTKPGDPWTISHIITPDELGKELKNPKYKKPLILQVGFKFLYDTGHIPDSKYVGPASKKQGITSIKKEVKNLKKNTNIVIYCGCCPWSHCPNIRPAYKTLKDLGFTNVKALYIQQDFGKDWSDQGYPVAKNKNK